jgi:hypothetical protein
MTDVRLTALNPVDSQVYPVACNTSGELLVADDGTEYLPLTGGDLTGPLTSTSSITAASITSVGDIRIVPSGGTSTPNVAILATGTASFGSQDLTSNSGVGVKVNVTGDVSNVVAQSTTVATSFGEFFGAYRGPQNVFRVTTGGNMTLVGTVTASNVSDIRFKENITDAIPQLADTVALGSQLKNFDWTDDAPLNEELRAKRFLGLVAQEAEKVCPSLTYTVPRTKQGKELTPEVVVPAVYETKTVLAVLDDEGETIEAETTKQVLVTEEQVTPATYEKLDDSYKAINHDILVMKLLGAVAELSAKVAALEAV